MVPWTWCPSQGTAHNPCCVADVVRGGRIRDPPSTFRPWWLNPTWRNPARVQLRVLLAPRELVKLWDISRKAHLFLLEQLSGVSRQPVKFFWQTLESPGKTSRPLLGPGLHERRVWDHRVICEEVEGKWSLLSKDRLPKVFCLTRKNERTDWWPNCLNFRPRPLGGAHTIVNTLRRGRFVSKLSFKAQFGSRGELTSKLFLPEAEKQPPHLNPSGFNVRMAGLRSSWWQQGGGHRIYLRIGRGLFLEERAVTCAPQKGPCPRGPLFLPRGEGWHVQSAVAEAHSVCSAPGVGFSPSPFQACMSSASAQVSGRPGQRPSIRTAGPCARKARRGQLPHHPGSFLFTQTINRHTCKPSQDQTR